jgi:UDP-N-acetylmuramoylalanine--D-glutamate ligase
MREDGGRIAGRHFLVVGLGVSGLAAARFLTAREGRVTAIDRGKDAEIGAAVRTVREMGAATVLGGHDPGILDDVGPVDGIILSPGVPHTLPFLETARDRGIDVMGEIELAGRFIRTPMAAVTGTNGKTTATEWIGEMLRRSGKTVFVGGNIGAPLIGFVHEGEPAETAVVELSSFQLDTIDRFRPEAAALLNITPDHLDRYADMEAYVRSKARIFENQRKGDAAVLNAADPRVAALADVIPPGVKRLFFRSDGAASDAAVRAEAERGSPLLAVRGDVDGETVFDLSGLRLAGRHNLENLAAAVLIARRMGAAAAGIQSAIDEFKGLGHRLMHVATIGGVRFYDDSKATNVDAAARALEAFDAPILLIMGGRTKGGGFRSLADAVRKRVKGLFLMGEAAHELKADLGDGVPVRMTGSMDEAVGAAFRAAAPGDVVLLSPACASFDMYDSYAQRGEDFCRCVSKQTPFRGR